MFNFIKTLFSYRRKDITLFLWEDASSNEPVTFRLRPIRLFGLIIFIFTLTIFSILAVLKFTPVGMIVLNYEEYILRNDVLKVSERIIALQDSLYLRDQQMAGLREIIRSRTDTVFNVGSIRNFTNTTDITLTSINSLNNESAFSFLSNPDISFGGAELSEPVFPAPTPTKGLLSQTYQPSNGHFGIDIAATEGEFIRSIADGVVVSTDWTLDYGNVIIIQHLSGYVSVYKHTSSPNRKSGEFVKKGDILSTVSNTGLTSSGPHLHFELWQNGLPVDPQNLITD
jgi:murein DD-endopeptidase MepM/ murein hydrolase activator NlpD